MLTAEGLTLVTEEAMEIRVLRRQGRSIRETMRMVARWPYQNRSYCGIVANRTFATNNRRGQ